MSNENLIPIEKTELAGLVEIIPPNSVFLLERESARDFWRARVSQEGSQYFKLPDSCWICRGNHRVAGRWCEVRPSSEDSVGRILTEVETEVVASILRSSFSWNDDSVVCFCASESLILVSRWLIFLQFWSEFLVVSDECPIVLEQNSKAQEALIFTPLGEIWHV